MLCIHVSRISPTTGSPVYASFGLSLSTKFKPCAPSTFDTTALNSDYLTTLGIVCSTILPYMYYMYFELSGKGQALDFIKYGTRKESSSAPFFSLISRASRLCSNTATNLSSSSRVDSKLSIWNSSRYASQPFLSLTCRSAPAALR